MRPVLFHIPGLNLPVYGYGMALFAAYLACTWLGGRLAKREGIEKTAVMDLAIYVFVGGLIGGRLTFVLQEYERFFTGGLDFWRVIAVWDGGLVLYGAVFGAFIGFLLAHRNILVKQNIPPWKMLDVSAPCVALGIALGRVGCLLSGCCFGQVACADCPALSFPLPSEPAKEMVRAGYQTYAGFLVSGPTLVVTAVELGSPAAGAGLREGDRIASVNGVEVDKVKEGRDALLGFLHGNDQALHLTVRRGGDVRELPPFRGRSLGLHPTQVYETVSMVLLLFFLLSYYPYKSRDGAVLFFLMVGYALHRFVNEMLRADNEVVALDMTFSQLVSLGMLLAAAVVAWQVWGRRPAAAPPVEEPAETAAPPTTMPGW